MRARRSVLAAIAAGCIASGWAADAAPRAFVPPDVAWPADTSAPVDPAWISERSTGAARTYLQDFAEAAMWRSDTVARYDSPDALPMPPRGVLLRVMVGANGQALGFRVFGSSGDADYDELVMQSLYTKRPLLAPPPALLQGKPTLYVIGMFALGFSQKEDRSGPIYAKALMTIGGRMDTLGRAVAFRAAVAEATRRDFTAHLPATDRPLNVGLLFVVGTDHIASVDVVEPSGDPRFDALVQARARAAVAPLIQPDGSSLADWRVRYRFEPPVAAAASSSAR